MATSNGIVWYWNGKSGWIKQTGVEEECTCLSRDVMLLAEDIVSGEVVRDCAVTFETYEYADWRAHEVTVV
jgi:hypothetical protein